MFKLNTYYGNEPESTMVDIWTVTKTPWTDTKPGITGNPNVTLVGTQEADYMAAGALMLSTHEAAPTGTETEKENARDAMADFKKQAGIVATEGNLQCGGVESKLKSLGLEMAVPHAAVGQMDKPVIESATSVDGVVGREIIVFKKSTKFCHGTWVRLTNVATGVTILLHVATKERFPLTGLIPQTQYSVQVAYDGTDPLIVWSDPKTFWAQ
jgi:hypothetical protein